MLNISACPNFEKGNAELGGLADDAQQVLVDDVPGRRAIVDWRAAHRR